MRGHFTKPHISRTNRYIGYGNVIASDRIQNHGINKSDLFLKIQPIQQKILHYSRADSRFVPIQWEMSLQSNSVSQRLGAKPRISLVKIQGLAFFQVYYFINMPLYNCDLIMTVVWTAWQNAKEHGIWRQFSNSDVLVIATDKVLCM